MIEFEKFVYDISFKGPTTSDSQQTRDTSERVTFFQVCKKMDIKELLPDVYETCFEYDKGTTMVCLDDDCEELD